MFDLSLFMVIIIIVLFAWGVNHFIKWVFYGLRDLRNAYYRWQMYRTARRFSGWK